MSRNPLAPASTVLETAARLICEKGYEAASVQDEAAAQLRGEAGPNQVPNARVAMTQSIGGHGSIAVTHVLEA